VGLGDIARARARHLAGIAAQRAVRVEVVEAATAAQILADPHRLAQVFDNLLENAIRYTPPGGRVTVTLTPTDSEWRCSVTDTGAGIPAQHLPFIFDRFYRADASRSRAGGGSGLGLAITRALVEAHGGRIAAESREGTGTTITFWLPVSPNCP
jgi:two-component system sensor histidine kinase BaeS